MTSKTINNKVKAMNEFIWTLKNKCESINGVNKELIMQYCRFACLADETSKEIQTKLHTLRADELDDKLKLYEKLNKITLNLYKVLKFESIKEEIADFDNGYTKLIMENKADDDF